jgi:nicotinamidase-related amidase
MWDKHWCTGANRRGAVIAEKINETAKRARAKGSLIIHAPSDTDAFYAGAPARERFLAMPKPDHIPQVRTVKMYPAPEDSTDGGSDTIDDYEPNTNVWKRQTEKIVIDQDRDLISCDDGPRVYAHLTGRGIKNIIYMGVHTNMCVLGRSFGMLNMLRYGLNPILAKDLTDAMYNPEKSPYVNHDEGTRLIVEYIEKFYCPTIDSVQISTEPVPKYKNY